MTSCDLLLDIVQEDPPLLQSVVGFLMSKINRSTHHVVRIACYSLYLSFSTSSKNSSIFLEGTSSNMPIESKTLHIYFVTYVGIIIANPPIWAKEKEGNACIPKQTSKQCGISRTIFVSLNRTCFNTHNIKWRHNTSTRYCMRWWALQNVSQLHTYRKCLGKNLMKIPYHLI
jgi:hypothetical protein